MSQFDITEAPRREEMARVNAPEFAVPEPSWSSDQLREEFEVIGFMAPFVVVRRRSDGQKGSLEFTHLPRVYFGWVPHVG
jgi:hypothetical protein